MTTLAAVHLIPEEPAEQTSVGTAEPTIPSPPEEKAVTPAPVVEMEVAASETEPADEVTSEEAPSAAEETLRRMRELLGEDPEVVALRARVAELEQQLEIQTSLGASQQHLSVASEKVMNLAVSPA